MPPTEFGVKAACPSDPVVARILSAAGRDAVAKVPYGAEAGLFQAAGVPPVICGPGRIAQAHRADEYVEVVQIDVCPSMLTRLIDPLRA